MHQIHPFKLHFHKALGTSLEESEPMGWKPKIRPTVTRAGAEVLGKTTAVAFPKCSMLMEKKFLNASQLNSVAKTDTNR